MLEHHKQAYHKQQLMELFTFNDVLRAQESLCRAAVEWLHPYPKLTALHKATQKALCEQVDRVAMKWLTIINQTDENLLTNDAFLARVKRSAGYFNATLNNHLRPLIDQTREAKIANKNGAERLQTTFDDLRVAYLTKHYLLDAVFKRGFEVGHYLKLRQIAFLDALDEVFPQINMARRRHKEPTPPKNKREDTKLVSRRMFDEGKTAGDIAVARNLTISTVESHLAHFVGKGELKAIDVIGKMRYETVTEALNCLENTTDMKNIKEKCPDFITYGDIKVVLAEKDNSLATS